jgi:hypothetical protein
LRRNYVLMLDARQIFRKVSRSVYDFSPEQKKSIAAIVWLYRGQQGRFLKLAERYRTRRGSLHRSQRDRRAGVAAPAECRSESGIGVIVNREKPAAKLERVRSEAT